MAQLTFSYKTNLNQFFSNVTQVKPYVHLPLDMTKTGSLKQVTK